eukprot:12994351-Alexandrium_andersonii.AAC.1
MLRPPSLDMALDELIEADKARSGDATPSPQPAGKSSGGKHSTPAKKTNRPGRGNVPDGRRARGPRRLPRRRGRRT